MKIKQSIKMNRRAGICLGFFLLCPATQALALHGYTVTPLVTPEGSITYPTDVNDLGMVVGSGHFLWQNGTMTALDHEGSANAINASGAIAGYWFYSDLAFAAFHYSNGVKTNLGPSDPEYVATTEAVAINDLGDVLFHDPFYSQIFLWNNGAQEELYIWGFPRATDINNAGQVVGSSTEYGENGKNVAFLWQNGESRRDFCGSVTWESPCGGESYVYAINNNGLAVGYFSFIEYGAMLWDVNTPTDIYGTPIPIDVPTDINDSGVIIGESDSPYYGAIETIYRYDAVNGLHDLNTLIPQYSGWTITSANAISNNGYIVGQGMLNGELTGYLLTPIEDEIDVDLDGFGLLLDCNDDDPLINPDAIEIPYDGIDQDCNGTDLTDVDLDGFDFPLDCNDNDPLINPDAIDIKHDAIDQDCNGYDLTVDITKAVANVKRGLLNVVATSSLGADAALVVEGFGAMTYNTRKNLWTLVLRKMAAVPSAVTVTGIEGSETVQTTAK